MPHPVGMVSRQSDGRDTNRSIVTVYNIHITHKTDNVTYVGHKNKLRIFL